MLCFRKFAQTSVSCKVITKIEKLAKLSECANITKAICTKFFFKFFSSVVSACYQWHPFFWIQLNDDQYLISRLARPSNTIDIFRRWCKLNFGPLRDQVKVRHKEIILLLFIQISWNNWHETTGTILLDDDLDLLLPSKWD